jgi:UDP-galactopyranose mutase
VLQDAGVREITVIDRRDHIAGNTHDRLQSDGKSYVHDYGAHIFHTSSRKVWDFLSRFTEWNSFRHYVKATGPDGRVYSVPFSYQTLYEIYGNDFLAKWEADKASAQADGGDTIAAFARREIGNEVFERLIRAYTEKQWGRSCEELPASIIRRLPIRPSWCSDWFGDSFQGMPVKGYTTLFQKMLGKAQVKTGVEYKREEKAWQSYDHVFYSGPLDGFFDSDLGRLDYRSLKFEHLENLEQGCPVMNHCHHGVSYTRQLQWSHFYHDGGGGLVTREYSVDYRETGEPYYPIKDEKNTQLAKRYLARVPGGFTFGGRLATYQYFDMHQVIAQGMKHAGEWLEKRAVGAF